MLIADSLVAIGLSALSLGTIHEADGPVERTFWLRNAGTEATTLVQGYTSCGCTTVNFAKNTPIAPGDSTGVTLRFNPRGKGGEFMETATLVYGTGRKRLHLSLEGTCITSEETLLRQFPVWLSDGLRLSADHFDLGRMNAGETRERTLVILHRDEGDRRETFTITFTADPKKHGRGLQHIAYPVATRQNGKEQQATVTLDVFIK